MGDIATSYTIAILGAGSWGTAIAIHLANNGYRVIMWGRNAAHIKTLQEQRCNEQYLSKIKFPENLHVTSDLVVCELALDTMIAVPSHAFTAIINKIKPPTNGISWLTKGMKPDDNQLFSQMLIEKFGANYPLSIISGPSFAKEVAQGLPTALTLAGNNVFYQSRIQRLLHHNNLRIYLSHDMIGVQLSGTMKNVIAIACGISDGLGYGANARAALITRGLVEMRRLGHSMAAINATFNGLAGVGDLVLTCTDNQSRNRRFGLLLGQGWDIEHAEKEIQQVIEGKNNAYQIYNLSKMYGLDLPICEQIYLILKNYITPQQAVTNLMSRVANME